MSTVQLVIRDAQREIHSLCHGSFADAVIAALSAEPETIEELERALQRFIAPGEGSFFRSFSEGPSPHELNPEADAGIVIVDLAARLVVNDSTYSAPQRKGSVAYHDGSSATALEIAFHLSDDWELTKDSCDWRSRAETRRSERAANPPVDARAILYGEPLIEFIARECLEHFRDRAVPDDYEYENELACQERDIVGQIHARWMMNPLDDLRGRTPRELMMEKRDFAGWSVQDRAEQWTRSGKCPRGLDPDSAAYRFAAFGTHEMVVHYDMVRELIWSCREDVAEWIGEAQRRRVETAEFIRSEMSRLASLRDTWLDSPWPEYQGRTPRSVIHKERARVPEGISGEEAMVDHDCPLCQMMAESPGPVFWGLDGCNMDEDFAFSMHHGTYEEWERQQREREEYDRRWNEEYEQRRKGLLEAPLSDGVWNRSFSAPESHGDPLSILHFRIAARLSELIGDLKEPRESPDLIDRLNRDFGNLGEVSNSPDGTSAEALLEPVLDRFCQTLDAVALARADLEPKCADLRQHARRLLKCSGQSRDTAGFDEYDVPF